LSRGGGAAWLNDDPLSRWWITATASVNSRWPARQLVEECHAGIAMRRKRRGDRDVPKLHFTLKTARQLIARRD